MKDVDRVNPDVVKDEVNVPEQSIEKKKNSKNRTAIILAVVICLILGSLLSFFLFNNSQPQDKDLKNQAKAPVFTGEVVFGYNADQTTAGTKSFGIAGRQGFELAVNEINAKGGILGKKIRPVILDDKADKEISVNNMKQLIFEDKALAVVGPANSANALAWIDMAQDNEVIVITHIATATEITQKFKDRPKNYIFRVSSLDGEQARLYGSWIVRKTDSGKIGIIHDSTAYGVQGAKTSTEILKIWGKTPAFVKEFDKKTITDEGLVAIMKEAKRLKIEGLIFNSLADSNARLLTALSKVDGYEPVVVGTAANLVPELWELAGPLSSNIVFVSSKAYEINDRTKALVDKLSKNYETTPVLTTASQAYDAVYLLKASIENAGSFDNALVRDALEDIDNVQGVMKQYNKPFTKTNHEGINVGDMILLKWIDGKITKIDDDSVKDLEIR